MRGKAPVLGLLIAAFLASGCRYDQPPTSEAFADAVRDSVAAALAEFQRRAEAADWDAVGAMYSDAPGFAFYESGALQYPSAEAVRAAIAGLTGSATYETNYRDTQIRALAPGVGSVGSLFETTLTDSTGAQFSWGGALTMVWVHEPDGWKILIGHSSAPVPRSGG